MIYSGIYAAFYGYMFSCIVSFANVFTSKSRKAFYESERKTIKNKWNFILSGRSHCDHCNRIIDPVFLMPIFGFLISRGKCSKCHSGISVVYFLEEILAFILGFFYFSNIFHGHISTLIMIVYFFICYYVSKIDYYYFLIPGEALASLLVLSVLEYIFLLHYPDLLLSLSIPLTWFALLHLVNYLMPGKLGLADIHLIFIFTFAVGFPHSIYLPSLASFLAIPYFFIKNRKVPWSAARKNKIPFGLFLSLAFLLLKLIPIRYLF